MVNFDKLFKWITIVLLVLLLLLTTLNVMAITDINRQLDKMDMNIYFDHKEICKKIDGVVSKLGKAINEKTTSIIDSVDTNANKIINKKGSITCANDGNTWWY